MCDRIIRRLGPAFQEKGGKEKCESDCLRCDCGGVEEPIVRRHADQLRGDGSREEGQVHRRVPNFFFDRQKNPVDSSLHRVEALHAQLTHLQGQADAPCDILDYQGPSHLRDESGCQEVK